MGKCLGDVLTCQLTPDFSHLANCRRIYRVLRTGPAKTLGKQLLTPKKRVVKKRLSLADASE